MSRHTPDGRGGRDPPTLAETLVAGARLLASGGLVGAPVGWVGVGLAVLAGWPTDDALATVFALGTVALGFGVLGWSGSIFAGRGVEAAQRQLHTRTDWTERDSRRAMLRVAGFGLGVAVAVSLLETIS